MSRLSSTSNEVGAPEAKGTEIEVTPEMLEAGVAAYRAIDRRVADDDEYIVSQIAVAVLASRNKGPRIEDH